jgi:hypothetical protein
MNYLSSSRPRLISGSPCYVDPAGRPIAALPAWQLKPTSETTLLLSLMLMVRCNSASWHEFEFEALLLPIYWAWWLEDPEQFMRQYMNWRGLSAEPASPEALTLDDLGL